MLMIKLFDFALGECLAESVVEDLLGARCPGARVDVRASVPERRCPSAGVRAPCPSVGVRAPIVLVVIWGSFPLLSLTE
ncbi:unnamed protein product [Cochlearia groenlandica]